MRMGSPSGAAATGLAAGVHCAKSRRLAPSALALTPRAEARLRTLRRFIGDMSFLPVHVEGRDRVHRRHAVLHGHRARRSLGLGSVLTLVTLSPPASPSATNIPEGSDERARGWLAARITWMPSRGHAVQPRRCANGTCGERILGLYVLGLFYQLCGVGVNDDGSSVGLFRHIQHASQGLVEGNYPVGWCPAPNTVRRLGIPNPIR